jgi:hypothetical protein
VRFLLLFTLITTPAMAAEPPAPLPERSLFFPAGNAPAASNAGITPSAAIAAGPNVHNFIYVGPEQWSFWWQGQRVTAQTIPTDMVIESITPAEVRFQHGGQTHTFAVGRFKAE